MDKNVTLFCALYLQPKAGVPWEAEDAVLGLVPASLYRAGVDHDRPLDGSVFVVTFMSRMTSSIMLLFGQVAWVAVESVLRTIQTKAAGNFQLFLSQRRDMEIHANQTDHADQVHDSNFSYFLGSIRIQISIFADHKLIDRLWTDGIQIFQVSAHYYATVQQQW